VNLDDGVGGQNKQCQNEAPLGAEVRCAPHGKQHPFAIILVKVRFCEVVHSDPTGASLTTTVGVVLLLFVLVRYVSLLFDCVHATRNCVPIFSGF